MSINKLGILLFSNFLIFATAPKAPAQSSTQTNRTQTRQGTAQQGTASQNDSGTSGTHDTQSTTQSNDQSNPTTSTQHHKRSHTGASGMKSAQSRQETRQIQTALKQAGFEPGPIDGMMGPMTMTALRNYQSHNGLQVTGTLTQETRSALMEGASTTTRTSQNQNPDVYQNQSQNSLQNYSQNQTTTPDTLSQDQSTLSQDQSTLSQDRSALSQDQSTTPGTLSSDQNASNMDDVRQMQQTLADMGYDPGEANGMMTSKTQQAIREFQWLNGLPVSGNLDEQTRIAVTTTYPTGIQTAQAGVERELPATTTEEQVQTRTETRTTETCNQPRTVTSTSDCGSSAATVQTKKSHDHDSAKHEKQSHKESTTSVKSDSDASERIMKASEVLTSLTTTPDKKIPNELLERAEAIAVIPNMVKGAFGIGGTYGKGLVSQRMTNGRWSQPAFLHIAGGSFGAQLGVNSTDVVLVFTDRNALSMLEKGTDLKLGADASVTAGPIGRSAEAGVNANLESAIYAYSRAKGLFAGVALDGAVLKIDKDMNEKVYGTGDARQIVNASVPMNPTVQPFVETLDRTIPAKRLSQK